jgi:hypothetical protein
LCLSIKAFYAVANLFGLRGGVRIAHRVAEVAGLSKAKSGLRLLGHVVIVPARLVSTVVAAHADSVELKVTRWIGRQERASYKEK